MRRMRRELLRSHTSTNEEGDDEDIGGSLRSVQLEMDVCTSAAGSLGVSPVVRGTAQYRVALCIKAFLWIPPIFQQRTCVRT